MSFNSSPSIGLDSQCLSYLIDALSDVTSPADALAQERASLARIFFYSPGTLWTTITAEVECSRIRQVDRAELHRSWIAVHFGALPISDAHMIDERVALLRTEHRGENDCRILAEAESAKLNVLITNDKAFRRNLSAHTEVLLAAPIEYWTSMAISAGTLPQKTPTPDNPLAKQTWWRV